MTDRQRWRYFLPFLLLFLSGFYLQSRLFLSPDATWLLYVSDKMLDGWRYGRDIFETNPPMILWLNMPVVLIQRLFHLSYLSGLFLVYIYMLTALSLSLCAALLARASQGNKDNTSIIAVLLTLTAAMLFLPLYAFGQRDILWLMLILPWMGGAVCRLRGRSVPSWQAVTAGLLAGVGFALKPYFLCVLCPVELYVMWSSKRLFGWWRTETAVILAVFVIYLGAIAILQPGYFDTILPLVMRYYFVYAMQPWHVILLSPFVIFVICVAVYYMVFRAYDGFPALGRVLLLVLLGTLLSYGLAATPWYYHLCPAFIMSCVLLVYMTTQMIEQGEGGWGSLRNSLIPSTMAGLMLLYPLSTFLQGAWANRTALQPMKAVADIIRSDTQNTTARLEAMSLHNTADTIIPANMAGAHFVSGMPFYWWYGGMVTSEMRHLQPMARLAQDRQFLIDMTAREIKQSKPQWIVVNGYGMSPRDEDIHKRHPIDWLQNMMLNMNLKEAFRCYQFYALSNVYRIYKRRDICPQHTDKYVFGHSYSAQISSKS